LAQKKIKLEGKQEGIPTTALREISNLKMLMPYFLPPVIPPLACW
jgi:hypothetical protein